MILRLVELVWVALVVAIFIATAGLLSYSYGSPSCLTKHEARAKWPTAHLYWFSGNHCWSNRRGPPITEATKVDPIRASNTTTEWKDVKEVVPTEAKHRGSKVSKTAERHDAKPKKEVMPDKHSNTNRPDAKPQPKPSASAGASPTILYPEMRVSNLPPSKEFFIVTPMTQQPIIFDVDDQPTDVDLNGCCWPALETLDDNGNEVATSFAARWQPSPVYSTDMDTP